MHQEEFQKVLIRYKQGLCSPEEKAFVEEWFRSMGSWEDVSLSQSEKAEVKQRSWTRVQDHMARSGKEVSARITKKPLRRTSSGTLWAIAATILIVAVSGVYLIVNPWTQPEYTASVQDAQKHISNETERAMEVLLSDGSEVFLQPKSSIRFKEPFADSQRVVDLEGEAFFEVSKDSLRPFLVNTGQVITKVLGTSFTISAFPENENVTVAVITGRVSVMTKQNGEEDEKGQLNETILTPNQKIIYNKNKKIVSRAIVNEPAPIHSAGVVRRMVFEAAPISEIFEGLEQVYGVDIEFDAHIFSSCILTTSIAGGKIYDRLDMICKAIDAHYTLKENRIVITGKGCDQ